jgi:hypothetical protein
MTVSRMRERVASVGSGRVRPQSEDANYFRRESDSDARVFRRFAISLTIHCWRQARFV